MRVLYYNWVDYLDDENRGGGVTVYQRNLMNGLSSEPGIETVFLAAGTSYDLPAGKPRWESYRYGPDQDREKRFEIINSACMSPAHHGFGDAAQISDPATEAVFFDFVEKTGPYDVIHFNNLEGLPAEVLTLKQRWPDTRVVFSLHNYYPICPQVNLWFQETRTCDDFGGGRNCANCLEHRHNPKVMKLAGGLSYRLKRLGLRPGKPGFDLVFRWSFRIGGRLSRLASRTKALLTVRRKSIAGPAKKSADAGRPFRHRRARMLELINNGCDDVLCVSKAVRDLAADYGIRGDLLSVSYIGTREAAAFQRTKPRPEPVNGPGTLTLAYLGYMRRDKGFFFLLDAFEALPDAVAGRLRLVLAARRSDAATMARIETLGARLKQLEYHDGYSHDKLDEMLARVDVGVVPVLWHDNLPQVAIEMHARHIPLLCADMGGAQELGGLGGMIFPAGDVKAFGARVADLLDQGFDVDGYWANAMTPVSMADHIASLIDIYRGEARAVTA